jgi:hypothetical protein
MRPADRPGAQGPGDDDAVNRDHRGWYCLQFVPDEPAPTMNFDDFVAAWTTDDMDATLKRFRLAPWQEHFWKLVERGDPPEVVMVRGGRGGLLPFARNARKI